MAWWKEYRLRLQGDPVRARQYVGLVRKYLGIVNDATKPAKLRNHALRYKLDEGVFLTVQMLHGQAIATIAAIGSGMPIRPGTGFIVQQSPEAEPILVEISPASGLWNVVYHSSYSATVDPFLSGESVYRSGWTYSSGAISISESTVSTPIEVFINGEKVGELQSEFNTWVGLKANVYQGNAYILAMDKPSLSQTVSIAIFRHALGGSGSLDSWTKIYESSMQDLVGETTGLGYGLGSFGIAYSAVSPKWAVVFSYRYSASTTDIVSGVLEINYSTPAIELIEISPEDSFRASAIFVGDDPTPWVDRINDYIADQNWEYNQTFSTNTDYDVQFESSEWTVSFGRSEDLSRTNTVHESEHLPLGVFYKGDELQIIRTFLRVTDSFDEIHDYEWAGTSPSHPSFWSGATMTSFTGSTAEFSRDRLREVKVVYDFGDFELDQMTYRVVDNRAYTLIQTSKTSASVNYTAFTDEQDYAARSILIFEESWTIVVVEGRYTSGSYHVSGETTGESRSALTYKGFVYDMLTGDLITTIDVQAPVELTSLSTLPTPNLFPGDVPVYINGPATANSTDTPDDIAFFDPDAYDLGTHASSQLSYTAARNHDLPVLLGSADFFTGTNPNPPEEEPHVRFFTGQTGLGEATKEIFADFPTPGEKFFTVVDIY